MYHDFMRIKCVFIIITFYFRIFMVVRKQNNIDKQHFHKNLIYNFQM